MNIGSSYMAFWNTSFWSFWSNRFPTYSGCSRFMFFLSLLVPNASTNCLCKAKSNSCINILGTVFTLNCKSNIKKKLYKKRNSQPLTHIKYPQPPLAGLVKVNFGLIPESHQCSPAFVALPCASALLTWSSVWKKNFCGHWEQSYILSSCPWTAKMCCCSLLAWTNTGRKRTEGKQQSNDWPKRFTQECTANWLWK